MLPNKFKPLLACNIEFDAVQYPVYGSPKLDGVRCINFKGTAYSKSLKLIPNTYVQQWAENNKILLDKFDGELCVGSVTEPGLLRRTTSVVMSHGKDTPFSYHVFGLVNDKKARDRVLELERMSRWQGSEFVEANIHFVEQTLIENPYQLFDYEKKQLELGYEGTMLLHPDKLYKFGRASLRSAELFKRKPFKDDEFKIVGWNPYFQNGNEQTTNELGNSVRSSAKDGMIELPLFGSFICEVSDTDKRTFNVGSGLDMKDREYFYSIRNTVSGNYVKIKYQSQGKVGGIPELPIYLDYILKENM